MPHSHKAPPSETGKGRVRFSGHDAEVEYEVTGQSELLRPGPSRLRASISTTSETARAAFQAGEVRLETADGRHFRLQINAHSEGSRTAYGELRV